MACVECGRRNLLNVRSRSHSSDTPDALRAKSDSYSWPPDLETSGRCPKQPPKTRFWPLPIGDSSIRMGAWHAPPCGHLQEVSEQ
jgi:hypothetical protein